MHRSLKYLFTEETTEWTRKCQSETMRTVSGKCQGSKGRRSGHDFCARKKARRAEIGMKQRIGE